MKKEKKNKKLKFVIVSTKLYHGGTIVLHALCKTLCEFGIDAKMFYFSNVDYEKSGPIKFWGRYICETIRCFCVRIFSKFFKWGKDKNKLLCNDCKVKYSPFLKKNTVVIYPEIINGDPFKAKNKIVYLLNYLKEENKEPEGALLIYYREIFAEGLNLPLENKLHTSYFDLELYKRTNYGERNGKCYVIRKGKDRTDLPKEFDGVIVDDLTEEEKVRVFNECEYCISYDTQTAYSGIAGMCGCVSVVVPEEGKGKKDYLKGNDKTYGVAYGFSEEEIEWAKSTRDKVKEHYEKLNADSLEQTKNFVELCKKKFNL